MDRYILINSKGQRLTFMRQWSGSSEGHPWTEEERDKIIFQCYSWTFKPTHYQRVVVVGGKVVARGEKVEITT